MSLDDSMDSSNEVMEEHSNDITNQELSDFESRGITRLAPYLYYSIMLFVVLHLMILETMDDFSVFETSSEVLPVGSQSSQAQSF